jgi:RNA recognition motif-containing protein
MKIIVLGLARGINEAELLKLFNTYGKVESCNIVLDKDTGASKGFGFVEMPEKTEAVAAIKALNNQKVSGSRMRVKFSAK